MTVVEFLGMQRAGKSTQLEKLCGYFNSVNISYVLCSRLNKQFNEINNIEKFHEMSIENVLCAYESYKFNNADFLLFDRGLYDRQILLEKDFLDGRIKEKKYEDLLALIKNNQQFIDYAFLFMVSPAISESRKTQQRLEGKDNSLSNEGLDLQDNLEGLSQYYERYLTLHEMNKNKIILVNGLFSKEKIYELLIHTLFKK